MGDKKRLARAGLEVMDRLDLPGELAAGVGRMELVGDRQFYIAAPGRAAVQHGGHRHRRRKHDGTDHGPGAATAGHDGPGAADQRHHRCH